MLDNVYIDGWGNVNKSQTVHPCDAEYVYVLNSIPILSVYL